VTDVLCAPISEGKDPQTTNQVSDFPELIWHAHKLSAEEGEFKPGMCVSYLSLLTHHCAIYYLYSPLHFFSSAMLYLFLFILTRNGCSSVRVFCCC